MNVDSIMSTEPESNQVTTTDRLSSGESSSTPASVPLAPYGLTPEAMKALGEDGSQVLVCSRSRLLLFCGSSKALEGNLPVPLPAQPDDIFTDFDPNSHVLLVQQRYRSFSSWKATPATIPIIKAAIVQLHGTNSNSHAALFRRQAIKQERNLQLRDKNGGSGKQPDRKPLQPSLIVIKKVAGNIESHTKNPNSIPKPAKKKGKGSRLGVIFAKWKLSTPALPTLPLVPSVRNHLPWFYIANPGTSEGNPVFGNMATQQTVFVANSHLQSIYRLLYSKDGWLLFQGRDVDSYFDGCYTTLPVFLLNPTTGARIDLPSICYRGGLAAFCTTTDGTPKVVIFVISMGTTVRLYLVRPGGTCWEEHHYQFSHAPSVSMHLMVLCNNYLYCFYKLHGLIFKLEDFSWHRVSPGSSHPDFLKCVALEVEGKVVLVNNPEYIASDQLASDPIRFFRMKMSGDSCEWVDITGSDEELDERIWFINSLQSFSVKVAGSGQKMCWFARIALNQEGRRYAVANARALHCLNLTTRVHRRLTTDLLIDRQCAWVDLGCLSDHGLLDCRITSDDLLPGF